MKKSISLIFILVSFINIHSYSQNRAKLNFGAALAANDSTKQEESIYVFIKGDVSEIKKAVDQMGGSYMNTFGDIASINIKVKNIKQLAERSFVSRIEAKNPFSKVQPMHDSMLVHNRALQVHAGAAPLTQAYKGDNVVAGFIDTGLDFSHPDFQDTAGKTRIKFLWDQVLSTSGPPPPFTYGRNFTENAINNNFANAHLTTAASYNGHGTHVASEASGNGFAINKYEGMAPNTDIVFVALNFGVATGIADASAYIYSKAALLGKPCVINASVGEYYGSHDGKDLQAQAIKNLIIAQPGRSFVAAAGNYGALPFHLGYTVSSTDTNFTWFGGAAYIGMYGDTNDFKNIQFSIGADQPAPNYSFRGNIPFSTIASHIGVIKNDTIWNGSNRLCVIQSYGDSLSGVYSMEFNVFPDSAYDWRLMTTGTGKFDEWSTDVITANLADTTIYPALKKYKQPDLNSNMVSSFQCLNEVVTVGTYENRDQHINSDTVLFQNTFFVPGRVEISTGRGPTRDGRIKPDVVAPGHYVMGSIVLSLFSTYTANTLAIGGKHKTASGTSIASPSVAGLAALYLQMDPTASWQQVKNAITFCARQDSFTGFVTPNNISGYGKADAFKTLTNCVTSVEPGMENNTGDIKIFPNPSSDGEFTLTNLSFPSELLIYNVFGQKVFQSGINRSTEKVKTMGLTNGIYFCTVRQGEKIIRLGKIVISE